MALTQFAFGRLASDNSSSLGPALLATSVTVESVAPTGTAAATTATAPRVSGNSQVACRVATDTAVYVSFGSAPVASSDARKFFLPANSVEYFYIDSADKASVVTA